MIEGVWLWIAFLLLAATTLLTRGSFIVIGERGQLPAVILRALRYAPAAALSALVMPDLLLAQGEVDPFNPRLFAGLAVIAVALRWRNPWLPFIIGMGVLWAVQYLLPGP
ncbi:MAG: AzlD domain-containing protein [Sulfuritalea sp.]|nr:AzlD domain-containing protein [Sulfuritalea sp.]